MKKNIILAFASVLLLSTVIFDSIISDKEAKIRSSEILMQANRYEFYNLLEKTAHLFTKHAAPPTPAEIYRALTSPISDHEGAINDYRFGSFSEISTTMWMEINSAIIPLERTNNEINLFFKENKIIQTTGSQSTSSTIDKIEKVKKDFLKNIEEDLKKANVIKSNRIKSNEELMAIEQVLSHLQTHKNLSESTFNNWIATIKKNDSLMSQLRSIHLELKKNKKIFKTIRDFIFYSGSLISIFASFFFKEDKWQYKTIS